MTKEKLIDIIPGLLKTDVDLTFVLQPNPRQLKILVVFIRGRGDQIGK